MLYLSPFIGSGTNEDPFRPLVDDEGFSIVDLREDPTKVDGFCLLYLQGTSADSSLTEIGPDPYSIIPSVKASALNRHLGISIPAGATVRDLLSLLLLDRLRPSQNGLKEVYFNNQVWLARPSLDPPVATQFAYSASDTFDRADNADLGTSWTTVTGNSAMQILTNKVQPSSLAVKCVEYWNVQQPTDDQFSQATLTVTGTTLGVGPGPAVRMSAAANTYYCLTQSTNVGGSLCFNKAVAGVFTQLQQIQGIGYSASNVIRLEVNGTLMQCVKSGASIGYQVDTSITSGYVGISYWNTLTAATLDTWSGGDSTSTLVKVINVSAKSSANSGNITLNAPASPQVNDVWIAVIFSSDQVAHTLSGWTQITQGNGQLGTTARISAWWFRYAGTTPNMVVTHTAGASIVAGIAALRGCKTVGSPLDVCGPITTSSSSPPNYAINGFSTTTTNTALFMAYGVAYGNQLTLPPGAVLFEDATAGTTNTYFVAAVSPFAGVGLTFLDYIATPSATGGRTFTEVSPGGFSYGAFQFSTAPSSATFFRNRGVSRAGLGKHYSGIGNCV